MDTPLQDCLRTELVHRWDEWIQDCLKSNLKHSSILNTNEHLNKRDHNRNLLQAMRATIPLLFLFFLFTVMFCWCCSCLRQFLPISASKVSSNLTYASGRRQTQFMHYGMRMWCLLAMWHVTLRHSHDRLKKLIQARSRISPASPGCVSKGVLVQGTGECICASRIPTFDSETTTVCSRMYIRIRLCIPKLGSEK